MTNEHKCCKLRDWLYTSGRDFCNHHHSEFDKVIHIYREDHPDRGCDFTNKNNTDESCFEFKDGEYIEPEKLDFLAKIIYSCFEQKQKLLIHCHMGACRSNTIALFALTIIEKRHPVYFMDTIYRKVWEQCNPIYPNIGDDSIKSIIDWLDTII